MKPVRVRWVGIVWVGLVAAILVLPGIVAAIVEDGWADGDTSSNLGA